MSLLRETISKDFILSVQQGEIPGYSIIWKFGHFETSTTSAQETIWDGNGLYVYHLGYGASAKLVDVVSDNVADVYDVAIEGLDSTGLVQSEVVTINGLTPVTSVKSYSRIYRAYNNNGTPYVGTISISETAVPANIVAVINPIDQQTLMAVYTVPLGYTGYLIKGATAIGAGKTSSISYVSRQLGKVFRVQERFPLFESTLEASRPYLPIPELTDIEVRSMASSLNDEVSASFGILLVQN